MTFDLCFSPEFFFNEGEPYDGNTGPSFKPTSVWQAIISLNELEWAALAREVFETDPMDLQPETVMERIRQTNTCRDLTSPVEVWIDAEGYHTVSVHERPRHIPEPGNPGRPLCGSEDGETVAWLDRNRLGSCEPCRKIEAQLDEPKREDDGRFAYSNLDRVCTCGHRLGEHAAVGARPPCFEDCTCKRFEPTQASRTANT